MTATRRPDSPARERANELVRAWDRRPGPLGNLLGRVTSVDQVGVEERVDSLKRPSIKKACQLGALDPPIRVIDLATLAADKLRLWGISQGQIDEILRTGKVDFRMPIVAPIGGAARSGRAPTLPRRPFDDLLPVGRDRHDRHQPGGTRRRFEAAARERRPDGAGGRPQGREADAPGLRLTAPGEGIDRVQGLSLGADDYLVKPFSVLELIARVKAILRRTRPLDRPILLRSGPFRFDLPRLEAKREGRMLELTPREFRLLEILITHAGRTHSRKELLALAWEPDARPSARTVDVHIANLRRKLGEEETAPWIATVGGEGYRWITPVEGEPV